MKQRIRRLFSWALCLALLLGLFPVTAHAANYDMFITDVRVSDDNKDDILSDGVFSFDGDRTLTVRGSCTAEDLPIIASAIPDLIIRVAGNSVLRSGEAPAIVANADLTIVGPGTLELGSVDSCGIYLYGCGGVIRNISLRASGTWGIAGDKPDDENEYLHIFNADVAASGPEGAICDFGGGVVLEDCRLENGSIGASAIEDAEKNAAKEVSILHTGAEIPIIHAVVFHNARGKNPAAQFVNDGAPASEPAVQAADGYTFTGWYTDAVCQTPYDFSAPVKTDLALYSGWEYIPPPIALDRLQAAISAAEETDPALYTGETAAVLASALADARAALTAEDQDTVDNAAATLEAALAALEERPEEQHNPFSDVSEGAYYYPGVLWALAHVPRITNGVDDTHFSPDASCTRAQVVTFLWRAAGCPEPGKTETDLTDLKAGAFYAKAVAWAVETGITNGLDGTHFGPDTPCTRAQVVAFLWRAAGSPAPEKADLPFTDVAPGAFYAKAIAWAVEQDITKGVDETRFAPDAPCTRGQIVTFLYRAMEP